MNKRDAKHTNVQRKGRARDRGICQVCGSALRPEGHHAFDYQYGGPASIGNIVTLCHDCHTKVHRGSMDVKVL